LTLIIIILFDSNEVEQRLFFMKRTRASFYFMPILIPSKSTK